MLSQLSALLIMSLLINNTDNYSYSPIDSTAASQFSSQLKYIHIHRLHKASEEGIGNSSHENGTETMGE